MDSMVEENGTNRDPLRDPLGSPGDGTTSSVVVTSVRSLVHLLPSDQQTHNNNNESSVTQQVQSVIQANQQSVIQTPSNIQLPKGNVILVKPNSVIQTTPGTVQALQVVETGSDDSLSNDDDLSKKRRDILTRRPSYRKILNELGGGEIAVKVDSTSDCETNEDSELSSHSIQTQYSTVIPAGAIQIASQGETVTGLHTLTMTNATNAGGTTLVQYAQGQDGQFYVPVVTQGGIAGAPLIEEEQARKKEMRLLKNREAARECRRKKKEYIKCLENRVAVLENQNKTLIDELKALKELYCQQKTD